MSKKTPLSQEQIQMLQTKIKSQQGSARELARAQALAMYEKGIKFGMIEEWSGLKRSAVLKWRKRFIAHGIGALVVKKAKTKELLTKAQIATVLNTLKTKKPSDVNYEGEFWTTLILGEYIKREFNVEYKTKKPLYLLFKKARFTYHKPGQQYRNRNQEQIDQWVKEMTPVVQKHLADKNTVVLTGDEMVLSTQTTFQKIWLPAGSFPKVDVSNKRSNRSSYDALVIRGA